MTFNQINKMAAMQGWGIFHCPDFKGTGREWEIQKIDEMGTFKTDPAAIRHVKKNAKTTVCREAIKFMISKKADDVITYKLYAVL
jgi:hypothetical protein